MFGFGFPGFAGFPPARPTLYTPRLIPCQHYNTPTLKMDGISNRVESLLMRIDLKVAVFFQLPIYSKLGRNGFCDSVSFNSQNKSTKISYATTSFS